MNNNLIPTKISEALYMASISDVHTGHKRNTTPEILSNLRAAFPDNAETAKLDIIWIAGDFFDSLLSQSDPYLYDIVIWVSEFLRTCKKYGIIVRVLRGTPSHDWDQPMLFAIMNEAAQIGADIKYVRDLSIEYIERFGITVLYVPDEWSTSSEETLSQVHELLRAKGLDQVDYAIMHGQFEYQLPPHVKAQKHDSQAYLAIVRRLIFIGHVHIFSTLDRIVAQGSFDRLNHGEESPKGHVRALVRADGEYELSFVENKNAKKFVTIRCLGLSLEETIAKADEVCAKLPEGSFVRIETEHDNPVASNMLMLIRRHPHVNWSEMVLRGNEQQEKVVEEIEKLIDFTPITITRDNVVDLLIQRIVSTAPEGEIMEEVQQILEGILDD